MIHLNVTIQPDGEGKATDTIVTDAVGGSPAEKALLADLTSEAGKPNNRIRTALLDLCARLGVKVDG